MLFTEIPDFFDDIVTISLGSNILQLSTKPYLIEAISNNFSKILIKKIKYYFLKVEISPRVTSSVSLALLSLI